MLASSLFRNEWIIVAEPNKLHYRAALTEGEILNELYATCEGSQRAQQRDKYIMTLTLSWRFFVALLHLLNNGSYAPHRRRKQ